MNKTSVVVTKEVDINEMCRLCLNIPSKLLEIFESSSNLSIPMRIMACAALEVCNFHFYCKKIFLNYFSRYILMMLCRRKFVPTVDFNWKNIMCLRRNVKYLTPNFEDIYV